MKIFLTGGTGFVGSHFINQAIAAGHDVVCQRRSSESRPRVHLSTQPQWLDLAIDQVEARHIHGADVIVHLAAHTPNVPYDTFERCYYWNVMASIRLFEKALEAEVKNWVVAGSCFEYGKSAERYEQIPVEAPLEPVGSYPSSKASASVAIIGLAHTRQANLFIGRIFQVFGEGEAESRFWPSLRRSALAGEDFPMSPGEQIRDFIQVEAVATRFLDEAFQLSSNQEPESKIRIANVGTGHPQTLRSFAEHWWKTWGATGKIKFGAIPYRENEVMRYVPLVEKGKQGESP